MFFKLGTWNVHHKRNRMTPSVLLPWQHFWLQSLAVKNQICHLQPFEKGQRVSGAKFEEHCSNISRDILDWVLNCFSGTTYDIITHNTKTWIPLKRKKMFQKGKCHFSLLSNQQLLFFYFIDTLRWIQLGHVLSNSWSWRCLDIWS